MATLSRFGSLVIVILIIISTFRHGQNYAEHSLVVYDVSFSLRWLFFWSSSSEKGVENLFYPSHISTHVHASVKISPAQLSNISRNVNVSSWQSMKHTEYVSHQHNGIVSKLLDYYYYFIFFYKCMVCTSKRFIFLALLCMYLTWLTCWFTAIAVI